MDVNFCGLEKEEEEEDICGVGGGCLLGCGRWEVGVWVVES